MDKLSRGRPRKDGCVKDEYGSEYFYVFMYLLTTITIPMQ